MSIPATPLRDLAAARGRLIGTAIDTDALAKDATYRELAAAEFSTVTAENAMKWGEVEPDRLVLDWSSADALVAFAEAHGQQVHGHTLLWHNQLPNWLTGLSAGDLAAELRRHIFDEVTHFKASVGSWDVVNEPLNDDGSPRDTLWSRALGPGYVADAFRWAREADPDARLYLNDYNTEQIGPKSDAQYDLVRRLLAAGVPIDGVGFQVHLTTDSSLDSFPANLRRFADLGLEVAVTELDIRMPLPVTPGHLGRQADLYARLVSDCLAEPRCVAIRVWGFTDAHSWVPGFFIGEGAACLYDGDYRPKAAHAAVAAALGR